MRASMVRLLVVSVVVATTLSFGCGGEASQIVTQVQWSSSANQCLADQTPIFLNGESSPATCQALQKVASDEGLEVTSASASRTPAPVPFGFCCEMECTDSGGHTTCGPLKCGPCAY